MKKTYACHVSLGGAELFYHYLYIMVLQTDITTERALSLTLSLSLSVLFKDNYLCTRHALAT